MINGAHANASTYSEILGYHNTSISAEEKQGQILSVYTHKAKQSSGGSRSNGSGSQPNSNPSSGSAGGSGSGKSNNKKPQSRARARAEVSGVDMFSFGMDQSVNSAMDDVTPPGMPPIGTPQFDNDPYERAVFNSQDPVDVTVSGVSGQPGDKRGRMDSQGSQASSGRLGAQQGSDFQDYARSCVVGSHHDAAKGYKKQRANSTGPTPTDGAPADDEYQPVASPPSANDCILPRISAPPQSHPVQYMKRGVIGKAKTHQLPSREPSLDMGVPQLGNAKANDGKSVPSMYSHRHVSGGALLATSGSQTSLTGATPITPS